MMSRPREACGDVVDSEAGEAIEGEGEVVEVDGVQATSGLSGRRRRVTRMR